MKIIEPYKNNSEFTLEYEDSDDFSNLEYAKCRQAYGVCFYNNQLLVARGYFGGKGKEWGLVGGTIEPGETFEETLKREIIEESNMQVLKFKPIGYQKVINNKDSSYIYQLRFVCTVEPLGDFISDPAGGIVEIKLIDPKEYKSYFDWGQIGERLVSRALEILKDF